jgi:hypothetical protein
MNPGVVPRVITVWELVADRLGQASPKLPATVAHLPRMVSWWNKEVSRLKASTRRLINQALCSPVVNELKKGLNENDIHWVMQMTMLSPHPQKIPEHHPRASPGGCEYDTALV